MVSNYGVSYEFDKEQRKILNLKIMGSISLRKASRLLDVSTAGVYSMLSNYATQLYQEGRIKLKQDGPNTVC